MSLRPEAAFTPRLLGLLCLKQCPGALGSETPPLQTDTGPLPLWQRGSWVACDDVEDGGGVEGKESG